MNLFVILEDWAQKKLYFPVIFLFCECAQHLLSLSTPGDFQFSVSSDDNSEFWLSSDDSPLNVRLLVYVGQVSTEPSSTFSKLDGPQ